MLRNLFLLFLMLVLVLPSAGAKAEAMEDCGQRMTSHEEKGDCPLFAPAHKEAPPSEPTDCETGTFLNGCLYRTAFLPVEVHILHASELTTDQKPVKGEQAWSTRELPPPLRPPISVS